mmetsp:Transcript_8442/g.9814  ORF Transcript_8442/g.9814 Transcript_8442/m.9814 type:complete len:167 (+) Transcript_8442:116-616(+)|eukprot:CAMPEP_0197846684 /NCGR_PEP_ID=MMETSP1438-20131217/4005_1 /TAXON_ID=1461541 /ORGANISM="Pterosperma sp., Strain CCMP1384" /LENGTH=166 /DNA_ID=CAMNT_0043458407 /DNA_START=116 /DNA_END=616 /DNA_ORIENTATION=+
MASIAQCSTFVVTNQTRKTASSRQVVGLAGSSRVQRVAPRVAFRKSSAAVRLARGNTIVAAAVEDSDPEPSAVTEVLTETLDKVSDAWDATEDKPAVVTLGLYGIIVLVGVAGILEAVENLPLVPNLLELVGIAYSLWFVYRYLLFKPDREELKKNLTDLKDRIIS